jgi:putative hydrolase of the HAD superfamily
MKKALILDLDNTIYSVESIGNKLFAPLFNLLESEGEIKEEDLKQAKEEIMKRPFQKVADKYKFRDEIIQKGIVLLRGLTCDGLEMKPLDGYEDIKALAVDRFLVTTGFLKMQESKVKALGISADFKEIFIVDPESTSKTKKDIFAEILKKYHYRREDVLVIGDDPESEINAAKELGIDTFLFDPSGGFLNAPSTYRGGELRDVKKLLEEG